MSLSVSLRPRGYKTWVQSITQNGEHSGLMVECLSPDGRATGSSITGITVLCLWARHSYTCLVLVQPRKTRPGHNWKIGHKELNQTKQNLNQNKAQWLAVCGHVVR